MEFATQDRLFLGGASGEFWKFLDSRSFDRTLERRFLRRAECRFVVHVPRLKQSFDGINISLAGLMCKCDDWVLRDSQFDMELLLPGIDDVLCLSARAITHRRRPGERGIRVRILDSNSRSLGLLSRWMLAGLN